MSIARPATSNDTFADKVVLGCATVLGLGRVPWAPGTAGTLAAIPLWALLSPLPAWGFALCALGFSLAAVLVADKAERIYGTHDMQRIVIDEVAGMLVTAIGVPFNWRFVLAAFVLFRLLDMTKPPPIGIIDKRVPGGLGVVLDDVAAGLVGCAFLHAGRLLLGDLL